MPITQVSIIDPQYAFEEQLGMDVKIFQGPGKTPVEFATGADQLTLIASRPFGP